MSHNSRRVPPVFQNSRKIGLSVLIWVGLIDRRPHCETVLFILF